MEHNLPQTLIWLRIGAHFNVELRFAAHFSIVQKHFPLINKDDFLEETLLRADHQSNALHCAVAMSGAVATRQPESLCEQYYASARYHLEKAETQADDSSMLNLQTVQAMILLVRFEFCCKARPRAFLNMARLMQLVNLMGYDNLDGQKARPISLDNGSHPRVPSQGEGRAKLQDERLAFWIAYAIYCNYSTDLTYCGPIEADQVRLEPSAAGVNTRIALVAKAQLRFRLHYPASPRHPCRGYH